MSNCSSARPVLSSVKQVFRLVAWKDVTVDLFLGTVVGLHAKNMNYLSSLLSSLSGIAILDLVGDVRQVTQDSVWAEVPF